MTFTRYKALLTDPEPVDLYAKRVTLSGGKENPRGEFVLYWAQSARRMRRNLALNYAVERANELGLPVVVYESIRPDYPSANDRIHSFVLQGVRANAADAAARNCAHSGSVRRSCQTMALWIGDPVTRSQTTTVSR